MTRVRERCAPGFFELVETFPATELESHPGTVFGLWPDLRLAYFNPAWIEFARTNGGPAVLQTPACLGTPVLSTTPEVLRPHFAEFYGAVLHRKDKEPPTFRYECSSADCYREFAMTAYPLSGGNGLLVVNSLVVEEARAPDQGSLGATATDSYLDEDGFIHQCAHCRRVQYLKSADRWDWVADWVRQPSSQTSHTLCPICLNHFYPDDDR